MYTQILVFKTNLDKNSDLKCININSYKAFFF